MIPLPVIPGSIRVALAVAGVLFLAYQLFDYGRTVERQACELATTTTSLNLTTGAVAASEQRRGQENATNTARTEALDEHAQSIMAMADQRNAAFAAGERLRHELAAAKRRAQSCGAPSDPAAEQSREAVEALAAVFGACEAEQRDLAQAAASHLAAGELCVGEYEALTATPINSQPSSP